MGEVGYDTFKQMTTTTAVFQEGLRLHPSVPKNAWEALGPDVLPNGGPRIEKGDMCVTCLSVCVGVVTDLACFR